MVWAASGTGLPDVPVNAFDIDPSNTQRLFAGTDVGMYTSLDGGATWAPYTTGMPVVAVFDMKIQPSSRTLRVATHGRGLWERALDPGSATDVDVVGTEIVNGHPRMTWHSSDASAERVRLYRREVPGDMQFVTDLTLDASGRIEYEDASAQPGRSYEYQVERRVDLQAVAPDEVRVIGCVVRAAQFIQHVERKMRCVEILEALGCA